MKKLRCQDRIVLALSVLLLGAFGLVSSSRGESVTEKGFVGGDRGPMIVLQDSATAKWQGTGDWDNSRMNGGNVETDYDVICEAKGHGQLIKRYNRDMLVLDDSEWGAYMFTLASGATAIVQQYGADDETIKNLVERVTKKRPSKSFRMNVQDRSLRLLMRARAPCMVMKTCLSSPE